jgi:hypothetical protein
MKRSIFALSLLTLACDRPATQLIVVVDTDYTVPGELGFIRAIVRDENEIETSSLERDLVASQNAADDTHATMPCSFAVVPKGGDASRTVIVEIEGFDQRGGRSLVVRRAVTGFVKEETRLLTLFLAKSCEGLDCGAGQTCTENGCASDDVDPNSLPRATPGNEFVPPTDGGTDAGLDGGDSDGGPDSGATDGGDAGTPDDAGAMDADCPPAPSTPSLIGTVNLPHFIDQPLLAADVDGDGVGEIVAAHGGSGSSAVSVIDFDACGAPSFVTTTLSGDLRRAPAFVVGMSGPEIWLPFRLGVEAWRFSPSAGTPLERAATILEVMDLEQLAIASHGATAGAIVRHSTWGAAHLDTQTRVESFTEHADRPRNLTYVGEVTGGALFAGASPTALHFLEPGQATSDLPILALSQPMSVGPDAAFGSASAAIIVTKADRAVVAVRTDLSSRTTATSSISFPDSIVGEPMLVRVQGEVRVYVQLRSDLLTWCTLSADPSSVMCALANPGDGFVSGGEIEDEGSANLLSAYLDNDATPDIVVLSKDGDVYFRSGVRPADEAAPRVRMSIAGEPHPQPAALLPRFWTSFGSTGDLLAVPFEDGTVQLISWSAPASAPASTDGLWTQARKDEHRSAHLP